MAWPGQDRQAAAALRRSAPARHRVRAPARRPKARPARRRTARRSAGQTPGSAKGARTACRAAPARFAARGAAFRPGRWFHSRNSRPGRPAPWAGRRARRSGSLRPARAVRPGCRRAAAAKASRSCSPVAVDLAGMARGAEHQIGVQPQQAVAPAHFAAFDRFEQEIAAPRLDQLDRRADRGFGIGNQPPPDQRGLALRPAPRRRHRGFQA